MRVWIVGEGDQKIVFSKLSVDFKRVTSLSKARWDRANLSKVRQLSTVFYLLSVKYHISVRKTDEFFAFCAKCKTRLIKEKNLKNWFSLNELTALSLVCCPLWLMEATLFHWNVFTISIVKSANSAILCSNICINSVVYYLSAISRSFQFGLWNLTTKTRSISQLYIPTL